MCHLPGSVPPELPDGMRPISGGAGGSDAILTSEDGGARLHMRFGDPAARA